MPSRAQLATRLVIILPALFCDAGTAHALPGGIVASAPFVADPASLCAAALSLAQQIVHTPPGLLNAIATVESGHRNPATNSITPWPWTIDANGTGHVYPTEAAAIAAAKIFQQQGTASLDIGCMQINLQQHPDAFATLAAAFDPPTNALYGARFLRRLKTRLGDWNSAIGGYHSQTPSLGLPYEQKVLAAWTGAPPAVLLAANKLPTPPATQAKKPVLPPTTVAMRHFGAGGFQFSTLHTTAPPAAIPGRSLAAYRRNPIMIASVK